MRESLKIRAVVVDHEIPLNPSESSSGGRIQLVCFPTTVKERRGGDGVEVPVVRRERRFRPIGFHEAAPRCPVVGVPEARVNPHRLVFRKGDADRFGISEYSDGGVIHQETGETDKEDKGKF